MRGWRNDANEVLNDSGYAENSCQTPEFQWHNQVRIGAWCVANSTPTGQRLTHSWLSLEGRECFLSTVCAGGLPKIKY